MDAVHAFYQPAIDLHGYYRHYYHYYQKRFSQKALKGERRSGNIDRAGIHESQDTVRCIGRRMSALAKQVL